MPTHIGAETDLRFVYCAGKDMIMQAVFFAQTWIYYYIFFILLKENSSYFIFSAAICFMLENWSGMDREKAKEYILSCQVI